MGGLGDRSTTEQSAIQAYLGPDNHSLPHHRPQSRRLPLGVVAINVLPLTLFTSTFFLQPLRVSGFFSHRSNNLPSHTRQT